MAMFCEPNLKKREKKDDIDGSVALPGRTAVALAVRQDIGW
jgi:hypothetical protein